MSSTSRAPLEEAARLAPSRGVVRSRVDPFPLRPGLRRLVRFAFALPYLIIAFVNVDAHTGTTSENVLVYRHVLTIDWSRADVHWVSQLYPPVGMIAATGVTRLIPLGPLGLSLLGALVAGYTFQKLLETMRQRQFPLAATVLFLVALMANPFTIYLIEQSTLLFLTLAFFTLGAENMTRFLAFSSTRDGFRAGIFFMLCALTDTIGITFVATATVASVFLLPRERREPGRRRADLLVVAFPTIGTLVMWFFLEWAFKALPIHIFGVGATSENTAEIARFFAGYGGWLMLVPVVSLWLIGVLAGRPALIVMTLCIAIVYTAALLAGFARDPSVSGFFVLLLTLLIVYTPELRPKTVDVVLPFIAAAQLVMLWVAVTDEQVVRAWLAAAVRAVGA